MSGIGIIDYGMGNLHSVKNALDLLGAENFISDDAGRLACTDGLILPGVGAFKDAADALKRTGLDVFIKEYVENKPMLGICLGMQLLLDKSYEMGEWDGLGLIHGNVVHLGASGASSEYKIPHMGWNSLEMLSASPLLEGVKNGDYVYFVHSYKAVPADRGELIAVCDYGQEIAAVIGGGNVFGTQFHPEKSGKIGLMILNNFLKLTKTRKAARS